MARIYNFSAGPATLPESVLEEAAAGVLEIQGSGMSILEVSHRGKQYDAIHADTRDSLLRVLGLSADDYSLLFIQGGASLQFAMLPMNLLDEGRKAEYVNAGEWGGKAFKEAKKVGKGIVTEIASSADKNFSYIRRRTRYRLMQPICILRPTTPSKAPNWSTCPQPTFQSSRTCRRTSWR